VPITSVLSEPAFGNAEPPSRFKLRIRLLTPHRPTIKFPFDRRRRIETEFGEKMTSPQPPETGGQPQAAVSRVPFVPPGARQTGAGLPSWLADGIADARLYGGALDRNEASEFSMGKGQVAPWVARSARAQRRVPQPPDDYGTPYRGTTPPCEPDTMMRRGEVRQMLAARRQSRGSRMLGRFLRSGG
jgi:hypothetical protein